MKTLWRALKNTIFWSYERGSWPYDVMVVLIVAFVLLTPRSWFRDQPHSSEQSPVGIVFVASIFSPWALVFGLVPCGIAFAAWFWPKEVKRHPEPVID